MLIKDLEIANILIVLLVLILVLSWFRTYWVYRRTIKTIPDEFNRLHTRLNVHATMLDDLEESIQYAQSNQSRRGKKKPTTEDLDD